MLEKLFKYPAVLTHHKNAPLLEERNRYLIHCAEQGYSHASLLRIARELFQIVQILDPSISGVTAEQIKEAGNRWARQQCRRGRAQTLRWSRDLFVQTATEWFRFIGCLNENVVEQLSFVGLIENFSTWMESERGLSLITIRNYCWHAKKFLHWCEDHSRSFYAVKIADVDTFLTSCGDKGLSRVSVATSAKALKAFFRYTEQHGWCSPGTSCAIQGPRLFSQESLPSGPTWEDVNRMIDNLTTDQPKDIRDRAIILLFALYGLRSSELAKLRLENINWESNQISVYRPKQRRTQTYPLIPIAGNAIIHYLRRVRPQNSYREIFLTLKAPIKLLSVSGLHGVVSRCMAKVGIHAMHRGPHALRHACATHLVSSGLSLKEIGDHLGHRSTSATRIYAKVDLPQLRLVSDINLGGLS
jgi:site-specific recombinase XerD